MNSSLENISKKQKTKIYNKPQALKLNNSKDVFLYDYMICLYLCNFDNSVNISISVRRISRVNQTNRKCRKIKNVK